MGYTTPAVLGVDEGHWWWRFIREDFDLKCQFSIGLSLSCLTPLGALAVQGLMRVIMVLAKVSLSCCEMYFICTLKHYFLCVHSNTNFLCVHSNTIFLYVHSNTNFLCVHSNTNFLYVHSNTNFCRTPAEGPT